MEKRIGRVFRCRWVLVAGIIIPFCMTIMIGCSMDESVTLETQPQSSITKQSTKTSLPTLTPTPIPEPVTYEGSGNQVIDVPEEFWIGGIFHAVYKGSGEFVVQGIDTFGETTDLFVDSTGSYNGKRLFSMLSDAEFLPTRQFSIETEGAWEITLYPFMEEYVTQVALPGEYTGTGDDVIFLHPPGASLAVSATGEGHITVWAYHGGGKVHLLDETAPYSGTMDLPYQTVILEILTTGPYTLEISD